MEIPTYKLSGLVIAFSLLPAAPTAIAQPAPGQQIKSFSVGPDQTPSYPKSQIPGLPDEHTSFIPPASPASPYLLFGASNTGTGTTGGAVVLQTTDFINFSLPASLGYSTQVMTPPTAIYQCNPAYTTEFDGNYAAPGSVVQDPTLPAGNFIMIYEAENHCPGGVVNMPFYATAGFARSSDSGKTWPAPINGVLGGPPRHPVLQSSDPQPSVPHGPEGDAIPSAFVDLDADHNYYLYVSYSHYPANGGGVIRVARAKFGADPLNFEKWYNGSFSQPGIGGLDTGVTPSAGCANGSQAHSEINYNDDLGLYLLIFVCVNGPTGSHVGAWYYSTATSLDLQDWTTPQMIQNSQFPVTMPCPGLTSGGQFDGWYPSTVSPGAAAGHTKLTGYFFFLNGRDTGARQFMSRTFTITTTGPPPPPPTISLSNTQLQFWDYVAQSSLTPPEAIGVSDIGGGTLSFTATPNAPWISVTYTSSGFTVSANPAGLAVGPHMSTISVASPGATNSPQTVTVTLTVSASAQIPPASAARFVPVTPCRIADTRKAAGPFGGPGLPQQTERDFVIPASACGIPPTAVAYSLNVAVVPSGPLGYLTLWPTGQPQPLVATLNSLDGRVKSNAAIVPAGVGGAISVFATDSTDVILDINGYFVAASNAGALAFYPLTPCRVADTRNAAGPLGGPSLAAQGTRAFPILASSCGLPSSAQAYSLNFAAVPKGPTLGFLTAWPVGQSQPLVASLNDPTGTVLSNAVVVPAGTGGAVNVYTTDATDLVIDINGYFAPQGPGGLSLYTVAPCRVLDSRLPAGSPPFNTTRDVNVTGSPCGVPATAHASVFNATVVPPGFLGFITMWPQGQTQPLAATLNAYDGAVTNNMAIVPTTTGSISVFPSAPTHLVLDIFGYFAP